MWSESNNRKWMVPALLIAPLLIIWEQSYVVWHWGDWSMIFIGAAIVMLIATLLNLWNFIAEHLAEHYANVRRAMNETAEVRMFEAAKGMHPDAVNILLIHRRSIWRVKYVPLKDVVDWIFDDMPTVHAGFVDFILDHSSSETLMTKRFLSEGSKQFDPEGIVTDYQQYDDLVRYMKNKLMITEALGNQPPKILSPWTVELLRHRFGLDGEGYGVTDDMSDALKAVVRAQAKTGEQVAAGSGDPSRAPQGTGEKGKEPEFITKSLEGLQKTPSMQK